MKGSWTSSPGASSLLECALANGIRNGVRGARELADCNVSHFGGDDVDGSETFIIINHEVTNGSGKSRTGTLIARINPQLLVLSSEDPKLRHGSSA